MRLNTNLLNLPIENIYRIKNHNAFLNHNLKDSQVNIINIQDFYI